MFYVKEMELCGYMKLNDKWIGKTPMFGSYCTINCWETSNDIFLVFLVFKWLISDWCHIWSWWVYHIDHQLPFPNCWVSNHWPVGCIKKKGTDINIAKPHIHKAAGSGINEMIFQASIRYTC